MNFSLMGDTIVRRIIKNAGIVFSGNAMSSGLNIVSFAILANQLGAESLGIMVLAQTYTRIANDLINVQTWESMIKFCSHGVGDSRFSSLILSNVAIDFVGAVVAFLAAYFSIAFVVDLLAWDQSLVGIASLYSVSLLVNITSLTIGVPRLFDKFKQVSIIQVIMAALKLALVAGAMFVSSDLIVYVAIYLSVEILLNITLIVFSVTLLNREAGAGWWKEKIQFDREQIAFVWWLNLRTIVRIPVRHFDMIVISTVISVEMVGVFKVYKEIASIFKRVQDPVNQTVFPEFTKLLAKAERKETARVALKTMAILTGVSVFLMTALLLSSAFIVERVFGPSYLVEVNALHALVVVYLLSFITVPVNSLFIASGFAKSTFNIVLLTNTIYLLSAYYFGGVYGIYGIVIAYTLQLVFNKGLKIYLLKKYAHDWGGKIR